MGDENDEFSLLGDFDLMAMLKKFIKENKTMIILIVLLSILGSYFYMRSIGYGPMQIMFVYLAIAMVSMFMMKSLQNTIKQSKAARAKKPQDLTDYNDLLKVREQRQQEIDDIDVLLDDMKKKREAEIRRIKAAQKGNIPTKKVAKKNSKVVEKD